MRRVLAIADDFTGAAEIAGIGRRYGLPTRLLRDRPPSVEDGLTVIDTDSRLLPPADAAAKVRAFVAGLGGENFDLIYKKTDSVLRGPILAELEALLQAFDRSAALLVPQNPSRGRTIRSGEYEIDGVALHATTFANDPQHPATSSNVLHLLGPSRTCGMQCLDPGEPCSRDGITIGAGCCADDLRHWASQARTELLPAGGAEFFQSLLEQRGLRPGAPFLTDPPSSPHLFVCGSASTYSRQFVARAAEEGTFVSPMPEDVFRAAEPSQAHLRAWAADIRHAMERNSRVLIGIRQPVDPTPGTPARLQSALANVVAAALKDIHVAELLIEGGATASEICRRMGWREFQIAGEFACGVVRMTPAAPAAPSLLVKPGSYPWPDAVWRR